MIEHRVVGNLEDVVLQLLEVMDAGYLLARGGVAEDEVSETHVLLHETPQVDVHLLRVLIDEPEALSLCRLAVLHLTALHDQRHILVVGTDGTQQLHTCLRILLYPRQTFTRTRRRGVAVQREPRIADDSQHVVGILGVDVPRLLIASRQHHLGTAAHTEGCRVTVERLGGESLALHKQEAV